MLFAVRLANRIATIIRTVGTLCSAPINSSPVDGKTYDWLFLALLAGLILTISGTSISLDPTAVINCAS
jgi:hypothetical protein